MPAALRGAGYVPPVEILPNALWLWSAWTRLSRDRPHQGGDMGEAQPRPIPLSAVVMWGDLHGYDRDRTIYLDQVIQMLDDIYLNWYRQPETVAKRKALRGG